MKMKSFSGAIGLLILLGVAELLCALGVIDPRFFSRPSSALLRLWQLFAENEPTAAATFHQHVLESARRFAVAIVGGFAFALLLTVAAALSGAMKRATNAIIGFLYPLPKSAIFPFLLLVFGTDGWAHIVLMLLGASALILATTLAGLNRLEAAGYLEIVRILKVSPGTAVRKVLLPGLLPELMHGLKLGTSYGLVLMIISETVVTRLGLGVVLWAAWDQFRIVDLYAVLYFISGMGFLLFGLFDSWGEAFSDSQRSI